MKIAIYTRDDSALTSGRFMRLSDKLVSSGFKLYRIRSSSDLSEDTGLVLSVGGDGMEGTAPSCRRQNVLEIPGFLCLE